MALSAVLVALAVYAAIVSARAASGYLGSLDQARAPIAGVPPVLGPAPRRLARRVALVVIDGLGLTRSYGLPTLDHLRTRGVDAKASAAFPTLSRPGYVTIVSGVPPRWSGVRTNAFDTAVKVDSLITRAHAAGRRVAYVSDISRGIPVLFGPELDDSTLTPWPGGIEHAIPRVLGAGTDLVIVLLSGVDEAGHAEGADSDAYRAASRLEDDRVARVVSSLDLDLDTIIVTADHGHIDRGGHGGVEPEVVEVPLIMAGAGVRPGALVSGARLEDVAPTIAALLGIPAPGQSEGLPLVEALAIDGTPAAELLADARARRAALRTVLDAIAADDDERVVRTTWQRAGLGLAVLAALIAAVAIAARRHIIVVDRRILSIAVPAFPLTFYGMVLAVEQYLSPSMLPSSGHLEHKLWMYGAIAAGAHLVAAWSALHERHIPRDRLAAAAGLAWVGLIVALAPAFAAWALVGQVSGSALPGPHTLLMAPVTYSVVCAYACATALALVIEHVVFVARATAVYRASATGA